MSLAIPEYGTATIDDYDLLPEDDGLRHELIDGTIIVCASATNVHNHVITRLLAALERVLPDGFAVLTDVDVAMEDKRQCPRPDLIVVPQTVAESWDRTQSHCVRLAVEVVSPGSAQVDRQLKPRIYATAEIPSYWLVDLDPFTITEYRAVGRWYEEVQRVTGDEIVVTEPFSMKIDVSAARAVAARAALSRPRNRSY